MFYYELKFDDYQNMVLSVNNVGMKVKSCRFVMIPNMPKLCFYKYNIFYFSNQVHTFFFV